MIGEYINVIIKNFICRKDVKNMKKEEMKQLVNLLNQYEVDFIQEKISSGKHNLDDYATPLTSIYSVRCMVEDDMNNKK